MFRICTISDANTSIQAGRPKISPLLVDCANGVGYIAADKVKKYLGDTLSLILENTSTATAGALNNSCGADYVKTTQRLPPSLNGKLTPVQRGCSLDGDADRLIYFYIDEKRQFRMLDGDKIASLVATFIVDLVRAAGLQGQIKVGTVQTAYANGSSTKFLAQVSILNSDLTSSDCTTLHSVCLSNVFRPALNTSTMLRRVLMLASTSKQMVMEPCFSLETRKRLWKNTSQRLLLSKPLSTISLT